MEEQHGPIFPPTTRRRSATQEELAARLTEDYPQASPHRVGHFAGIHPEDAPYLSQEIIRPGLRTGVGTVRPTQGRGSIPSTTREPIVADEEDYPEPPRRQRTSSIYRQAKPTKRIRRSRFHPLVFVGLGLFLMIIGWLSFAALSNWWSGKVNDWTYGNPRTYQTDQVVGHGDSVAHPSHFIAVNLNGQILVIEIPGGNASKAQLYLGPRLFGAGEDLAPVTVSFEDCNGDGKPDLNIHIQGSNKSICFVNNGKTFTTTQGQ